MSSKLDFGYLALDIECTGQVHGKDTCFAIGYANGVHDKIIEQSKFAKNLERGTRTWEKLWLNRGYEKRCYYDFWSKNLEVLDSIQAYDLCADDLDLATKVSGVLKVMENTYKKWTIIFDTVAFDSVWIDVLLATNSFPGLLYKRDGSYHCGSTYDTDSYYQGLCGVGFHTDRSIVKARRITLFEGYSDLPGAHDPEIDAVNILRKLQFAMAKKCSSFKAFPEDMVDE